MKAIIENEKTYQVTGERGDFFIATDAKGKVNFFLKNEVEIVEIDEMPKEKVYRKSVSKKVSYDYTIRLIAALLEENWNAHYILNAIEDIVEPTEIIVSICNQANKNRGFISEKQLFVLAKFAQDNNVKF